MAKITIDVNKQNLQTVLNILNNLKEGLVKDIKVDNKKTNDGYKPLPSIAKPITKSKGPRLLSKEEYKRKIKGNKN